MNSRFALLFSSIGIITIYGIHEYNPVPRNVEVGQSVHHKTHQGGQHMSMPYEKVHIGSGTHHAHIKTWHSDPRSVAAARYRFSSTQV